MCSGVARGRQCLGRAGPSSSKPVCPAPKRLGLELKRGHGGSELAVLWEHSTAPQPASGTQACAGRVIGWIHWSVWSPCRCLHVSHCSELALDHALPLGRCEQHCSALPTACHACQKQAFCLLLPHLGSLWVESTEPQPQVSKGLSCVLGIIVSTTARALLGLCFTRSQKQLAAVKPGAVSKSLSALGRLVPRGSQGDGGLGLVDVRT